jgi:peptidoglycan/xylan/chitin deacetylase (PgdA/CDA1 family)
MSKAIKESGSEPGAKRRKLLIAISIASILLLAAILAGGIIWLLNVGSRVTVQVSERAATNHETPVSGEHRAEVQAVAQQYMKAFLKRRYSAVWSLLNPQVQAIWTGEAAFAKFWQLRFYDYTVHGFLLGSIHGLSRWVDPETMRAYTQVILLPISLQIEPKPVLLKQASLPPEDLHPSEVFRDLPFIVQQISGQNKQQARWFVLDGGPVDLEAPILPPARPVQKSVQVPILMYHHISDAHPTNLLDWSLTVTPAHFSQQLDYLKAHNYHAITFNQLFAALYYNGPLPQHPIILTFDDGYEDAYRFAFPILQAHGFSGMFYIITGVVGWKGYLNWIQIRRMLADGMQVGSHTIHHVDIGSTLLYSPNVAQEELQQSQAQLQREMGVVIQQFCYPSGEPFRHGSLALQQRVVALLAADGYVGATTDPGQTGIIQRSDAPFVLLRIRVDGRESFLEFTASLPWNTKRPAYQGF